MSDFSETFGCVRDTDRRAKPRKRAAKSAGVNDVLLAALREIASGHCPPPYPMTNRGLLDYHRETALAAIAKATGSAP